MKFFNKETNAERELPSFIYQMHEEDELTQELLKTNQDNKGSTWSFVFDNEEIAISNTIQVKINIRDVGYVLVTLSPNRFNDKIKKELFEKLSSLKGIEISYRNDGLRAKLTSVFDVLEDYNPYYCFFYIEYYQDSVQGILLSLKKGNPIYYLKKKAKMDASLLDENIRETHYDIGPVSASQEGRREDRRSYPRTQPKSYSSSSSSSKPTVQEFKASFKKIGKYKFEHLFNALYSMLITICLMLTTIYIDNKNVGIGVLFIVFVILFVFLVAYNLYLYRKDLGKIPLFDYIFFISFSLIAVGLGVLLGWILAKNLIKFGDNPINYSKSIAVAILVGIPTIGAAHLLRMLMTYIFPKIKKK